MTDIGELVVRIRADAAQLQREMQNATGTVKQSAGRMEDSVRGLKDQLKDLVPALSIAAVLEFTTAAIDSAAHIGDMADRIGFTASTLSALSLPLKQGSSSVEEFTAGINRMNDMLGAAAKGNQDAVKAFDDLGLSVKNLLALNQEDRFYAIAQALNQFKDQADFTERGVNILGRSFGAIGSLVREHNGDLKTFVDNAKKIGDAITPEQAKNAKEFDAAWVKMIEDMKRSSLDALPALKLLLDGVEGLLNLASHAAAAGKDVANALQLNRPAADRNLPSNATHARPVGVTAATHDANAINEALQARGLPGINPAAGGNDGMLEAKKTIEDYVKDLQAETNALSLGKEAMAEYQAEKEAAASAGKKVGDLTKGEKDRIDEVALAYLHQKDAIEELQKQEEKHAQIVARLESEISSSLADVVVNWKGAGNAIQGVLQQIAKQIIEMQITTPLVEAIGGTKSGGGLLGSAFSGFSHLLGFAAGGNPPVGVPSIVGENGPEIFVPRTAGTIIPNGMGNSVTVQNVWNIQGGVTRQELASLIPTIQARTHASVFAAIERGGREARAVGRKS